ncbi:hypothetical protein PGT21_034607 [Puccinia graminis f. sp. tritici]|uniref:Uncharacterized protein n=1 Tax=Puccinia graminis f. sp. tritici TaxID=56615 RepID=A0A5B0MZK4_PUCGR|nr:hypothetical protein PGT21_034607 [Puccinia graminis f. sp. tritici]
MISENEMEFVLLDEQFSKHEYVSLLRVAYHPVIMLIDCQFRNLDRYLAGRRRSETHNPYKDLPGYRADTKASRM